MTVSTALLMPLSILLPLFAGIPIAVTLGGAGLLWLVAYDPAFLRGASYAVWNTSTSDVLASVPLYILMGDLIQRSGIAGNFYDAVGLWMRRLPGGLLHANIGACAVFSAVSGSSVATAATMGVVALPSLERGGYDRRLSLGSLAAGGTLGILIPPSIPLIIYGALVEESIGELFMAALIPGVIMALLFSLYIGAVSALGLVRPPLAKDMPATVTDYLRALVRMGPLLLLILAILVSVYAGWATTNEAAAFGFLFALLVAWSQKRLSWQVLRDSLRSTIRLTAMLLFIVLGAQIFSFAVFTWGINRELSALVLSLDVAPIVVLLVIILAYFVLGMFLDSISVMVLTLAIVHPILTSLGYDSVWFGVVLVILLEVGLITPPVGMNLFTIQALAPNRIGLGEVAWGALPFVSILLLGLVLLVAVPELALWLPAQMH